MERRLSLGVSSSHSLREVLTEKIDDGGMGVGSGEMQRALPIRVDGDTQVVSMVAVDPVCDFACPIVAQRDQEVLDAV